MVGVGVPANIPAGSVAVIVCPTVAVPESVGALTTEGPPRVVTVALAEESTPAPIAFTALMITW